MGMGGLQVEGFFVHAQSGADRYPKSKISSPKSSKENIQSEVPSRPKSLFMHMYMYIHVHVHGINVKCLLVICGSLSFRAIVLHLSLTNSLTTKYIVKLTSFLIN